MTTKSSNFLSPGTQAPYFELQDQNGNKVSLNDFKGTKNIVLYFYPRAMTPGCTIQACSIRDHKVSFIEHDAVVIGVSPDGPKQLKKFEDKEQLNFILVGDEDHRLAEAYGTWVVKNMYGRETMGMSRTTYIIDKNGTIRFVIPKAKPETHSSDVIELLKKL